MTLLTGIKKFRCRQKIFERLEEETYQQGVRSGKCSQRRFDQYRDQSSARRKKADRPDLY